MMTGNSFGSMIVGILILVVIFVVAREAICWYWKINRMVQLLESIEAHLRDHGSPR